MSLQSWGINFSVIEKLFQSHSSSRWGRENLELNWTHNEPSVHACPISCHCKFGPLQTFKLPSQNCLIVQERLLSYSKPIYSVGKQHSSNSVQWTAESHYLTKVWRGENQSSNISKSGRSNNPLKVAKIPNALVTLQWIISHLSREKLQTECEDIWKFLPSRLNDPVDFLFGSILGWREVCAVESCVLSSANWICLIKLIFPFCLHLDFRKEMKIEGEMEGKSLRMSICELSV